MEQEALALAQKEKEKVAQKAVQRKRIEEWELEKKGKKRKAPEEIVAVHSPPPLVVKTPTPKAPTPKAAKVVTETPKSTEKKQPISWLQFLESQRTPKVVEDATTYASQVETVDVEPDLNTVHEITAINDSDMDDALEVEFPDDIPASEDQCFSTSPSTGRHRCDYCPKTFSRRSDAERHIKKYHPVMTDIALEGENGMDPNNESYDFGNYNNLNLNATSCDVCGKVFTTKWSMQEHRDSVHEGIRFLCDHCDHVASSKRNLRGHMGKKHPDHPLPAQYTSIKADEVGYQRAGLQAGVEAMTE